MKKLLTISLAAGLLLYPFAAIAQDYGSQPSHDQQAPPVAQTLVREGDFAIKLAAKLDLDLPTEEATAEDILAKAGVVPENGWLSDYPVTPEILGQLQSVIAKSASDGKLPMTSDEAVRGLYSLAAELNLPTPAGAGGTPASNVNPAKQAPAGPAVINNYYYDQGPPIITYYEPPVDYAYLYAWVPYPVWWFGFWFPGFYICHNFTTTVIVSGPFIAGRHEGRHHAIVSNRVIDPISRRVAVVDPVMRTGTGAVRSSTVLRTENGRRFATLSEMRRDNAGAGSSTGRGGSTLNRSSRSEGYGTREARKSAESIYSRSVERMRPGQGTGERGSYGGSASPRSYNDASRGDARRYASPGQSERSSAPPARGSTESTRPYTTPSPRTTEPSYSGDNGGERQYRSAPERSFSPSSRGVERFYSAPSEPSRSYGARLNGRGESFRQYSGQGSRWQGRGR